MYTILMMLLGGFLIWWGMGDANLSKTIGLGEIVRYKRSRAVLAGLACILGSACYYLKPKK